MAKKGVNLDALIPREQFSIDEQPHPPLQGAEKITIVDLESPFFGQALRKPDFQRETNAWTPSKIVDLIRAFVDGDLIPGVILWKAGAFIFVIDGAHRLGALLAWIHDDYGDRKRSVDYALGVITDEQRMLANKTRIEVNKQVGPYQDYLAARTNPDAAAIAELRTRVSNLPVRIVTAQWVPRTDKQSAEDSFFKINQSATPIDPTETRLLKARRSASAIAARAISNAGRGHKYWAHFIPEIGSRIAQQAEEVNKVLFVPPHPGQPLTTLDVPIGGAGYNVLPFVFDLVNETNGVDTSDTTTKRAQAADTLPDDPDGATTLAYVTAVRERLTRITGRDPQSLGLHPIVYFYTRSGAFQPTAFLATLRFADRLAADNKLKQFTNARRQFEDFLVTYKEALGILTNRFGSGNRSLPWILKYYMSVLEGVWDGKTNEHIQAEFAVPKSEFAFLTVRQPFISASEDSDPAPKKRRGFNKNTKTAAFLAEALKVGTRCRLCLALVHRNSISTDHREARIKGGTNEAKNAQVSHPYCNSIKGND